MSIRVTKTDIPDLVIIDPQVYPDQRGWFYEVFRATTFAEHGLPDRFVQGNQSRSAKGVVRGLHFQWDPPMGKMMRVTYGTAFVVAVDVRKGSPTLGRWFGMEASAESKRQVWAPAGFARGFCAMSDVAEVQYLCTGTYNHAAESGILWNDPEIGIEWPLGLTNGGTAPVLSDKDRDAQTLAEWLSKPESDHFRYEG